MDGIMADPGGFIICRSVFHLDEIGLSSLVHFTVGQSKATPRNRLRRRSGVRGDPDPPSESPARGDRAGRASLRQADFGSGLAVGGCAAGDLWGQHGRGTNSVAQFSAIENSGRRPYSASTGDAEPDDPLYRALYGTSTSTAASTARPDAESSNQPHPGRRGGGRPWLLTRTSFSPGCADKCSGKLSFRQAPAINSCADNSGRSWPRLISYRRPVSGKEWIGC